MAKYRKKPIVIEAVQWTGSNRDEVIALVGSEEKLIIPLDGHTSVENPNLYAFITVPTSEGRMVAVVGDWIIKGVKGELYPCQPDIFEATYDPA